MMTTRKSRKRVVRKPRVCVVGLGHQAMVLSACFADMGYQVTVVGEDASAVASLCQGRPAFHEPELRNLIRRNLKVGRLRFTCDYGEALSEAEFVFIAIDTPVNANDEPQLEEVLE